MAITKDQALQRVREYLDRMGSTEFTGGYVVVEGKTIEKRYGWVFVFNSKKYLETGNIIFSLGGNGPIVVERESGQLHQLGAALSLQDSVKQFEEANGFDCQ
ncbi:YrhB domain-containing protein [Burkholderia diffusa]|uniref:YrhB domain-containing protein n=1 Tax=Burkholderia diffusa TaxID=488732 RepID=UPI00157B8A96